MKVAINNKSFAVTIILLILIISISNLSPMMIKPAFAQPTKPSVPEFTVKVQNDTVVLTIENQPFDVYNSYNYTFYYDVRITSIEGWSYLYAAEDRPTQSNSNQTILYYTIGDSENFPQVITLAGKVIPAYGQVFFQVLALVGYLEKTTYSYGLIGAVSEWSNSQSITLPTTDAQIPAYYVSPEGNMGSSYKLIVFYPKDQTIYDNVLPLAFMLRWNYGLLPLVEPKAEYAYSIDDNPFVSIVPAQSSNDQYVGGTNFVSNPSFSYSIGISNLPKGYHNIVIKATLYSGGVLHNASSTPFQFIVRTPTPTDRPAPTLTPVPTSTPTTNPTTTPSQTNPSPSPTVPEFFLLMILPLFLSLLFIVVFFRKRKFGDCYD